MVNTATTPTINIVTWSSLIGSKKIRKQAAGFKAWGKGEVTAYSPKFTVVSCTEVYPSIRRKSLHSISPLKFCAIALREVVAPPAGQGCTLFTTSAPPHSCWGGYS